MTDTAITAEGLAVGYGKVTVAGGISFTVGRGEVLTLIGPNGAGKSTVLRSIAAQLPILSGAVYIGGEDISAMRERELSRRISLVLTERLIAERMTCADVVETGRYPYTGRLGILTAEDRRAVAEAMELAGVTDLAESGFGEISDGQRQCVMLARAIAQQPRVMLLDEPTSFLDIHYKLTFLEMLDKLRHERNIAVVMSLHETELAEKISDTVLLLKNGRCTGIGKPSELLDRKTLTEHFDISDELYEKYHG